MRSLFTVSDGCYLQGYDFSALESRIQAHYVFKYDSEGQPYCNSLLGDKDLGEDCHTITAKKISEVIGYDFERDPAKSVAYACAYGAGDARVAHTIGVDLITGKLVKETYWESAKPLALLKIKLEDYWERIGQKKFILGLDGRKLPTRSKSSLINTLFQSGGTICVKRAMVMHDRSLQKQGLVCDFWCEDYRNKSYAQQTISMHDEAEHELTEDLVIHKVFPVEQWEYDKKNKPFSSTVLQEIREFRMTNINWSATHRSDSSYDLSYSIVGDLALQVVAQAGQYYALNVPLTAEYMIGKSWAEVH